MADKKQNFVQSFKAHSNTKKNMKPIKTNL